MDSNPQATVAPRLVKMPIEVIHRIAYFLPTSDLCQLRLACKAVESSTFVAFSHEFFAKKQFMLTEFSLQALIDISQHPTLGPSLNHLIIGLDRYQKSYQYRSGLIEDELQFHERYDAQQELIETGRASTMLAQALRNLKGLQTVDIRDFNSPTRWRDGGANWLSYGSVRDAFIGNGTGVDCDFVDCAFRVVLVALAQAGIDLPNLELVMRNRNVGLTSKVFSVRPWLAPTLQPVLTNLRKLHLAVVLADGSYRYQTTNYQHVDPAVSDPYNAGPRNFLTLTPNLTWLRVNFQKTTPNSAAKFLTWLSLPVSPSKTAGGPYDPHPINLPLRQLDLGVLKVTPSLLMAVLTKFSATLKAINLWDVSLVSTVDEWDDQVNLWRRLFKSLANSNIKLQSIMVGRLRQVTPDGLSHAPVNFGQYPNGTSIETRKCTSSAGDFLEKLSGETQVLFPPAMPDEDSDGDEDEDAEEESLVSEGSEE